MECQTCSYELNADDNFCENCGQKVQRHDEVIEKARAESASTIEENERGSGNMDFDQVKEGLSSYWAFCLNALKSPFNAVGVITGSKHQMIYGMITIVLAAITMPLIFSSIVRTLAPWGPEVPVVSPFFYILIFFALTIGVIFVVAKLGKSSASIQQTVSSFGSMMVIPFVILILSLIMAPD